LAGAIQLLVGPASFSSTEQMKVLASTRATSEGLEAQWNELGLMSWLRRVKVPEATSLSVSVFHSWSEPVTQEMRSGVVRAATSATQLPRRLWLVEPSLWVCSVVLVIVIGSAIPFAWRLRGIPPKVKVVIASDRYSRAMTLLPARGFEMVDDLASTQCLASST
jgi:hypothetical protein